MKKQVKVRYLIVLDYIITFYVYIIPPMLTSRDLSVTPSVAYSVVTVFSALGMCIIYYFLTHYTGCTRVLKTDSAIPIIKKILFDAAILLMLFVIQLAVSFLAWLFGEKILTSVAPPTGIAAWIVFIVGTSVLACFEEMLYRVYLPVRTGDILNLLIKKRGLHTEKIILITTEAICILCFAFAHRYAGWFAVANALCAGAVLRLVVKKTGTVRSACVIHSVYNCVLFILLMYL